MPAGLYQGSRGPWRETQGAFGGAPGQPSWVQPAEAGGGRGGGRGMVEGVGGAEGVGVAAGERAGAAAGVARTTER